MYLSEYNSENLQKKDIEKILYSFPEDDEKNGDCIWVFGSPKDINERVNKAVELYKNNRAPFILFTGGLGKNGTIPEASIMKEKAIKLGIPPEAIITEELSNNTTENILCSMLILERKFLLQNIKRLIVVTSAFHMQRLILTINRYMPKWIEYSYCYDKNSKYTKNNWEKSEETIERIKYEAKGIIYYAKNKYIDDKEIV